MTLREMMKTTAKEIKELIGEKVRYCDSRNHIDIICMLDALDIRRGRDRRLYYQAVLRTDDGTIYYTAPEQLERG